MRCRKCGQPVIFIQSYGRMEKCDPQAIPYKYLPNGPDELLLPTGEKVRCTTFIGMSKPDGVAYRMHYRTCPGRKKGRLSGCYSK